MEKMIKLFFIIFIIFSVHALDLSNDQLFNDAVNYYKNGDFNKALINFHKLNETLNSPWLYYNIGNCYIKIGKLGNALAAYYSAFKRDPINPDIRHNLKYAKNLTRDDLPDPDEINGITDVITNILRHFSLLTHQIIFLIIYFIFMIYILIIINEPGRYKISILVFVIILLLDSSALWLRYNDMQISSGVVTEAEASIRYGPSLNDTEAFILHEGAKFDIYNKSGNWSQIKLEDGKSGWISNSMFVAIK